MQLRRLFNACIYVPRGQLPIDFPVKILPDFISREEEMELVDFANEKLRKFKYEKSHFDSVIKNYRECTSNNIPIESKVMGQLLQFNLKWQPFHILDLQKDGMIDYHLDSYAGPIIAGLCLLSDSVMHLRKREDFDNPISDVYLHLPRRCLYIQSGYVRYHYEHSILRSYNENLPHNFKIDDARRISVLMRNPPDN